MPQPITVRPRAGAALVAGPPGRHRFPLWLRDGTGLRLGPALDPADPLCPVTGGPDEAVYLRATATLAFGTSGRADLVLTVGGRRADPTDLAGATVSGRVELRLDGATPGGTYVVTHPYGTLARSADARGRLHAAAAVAVPSFLRWAPAGPDAPAGYVGDGTTPHAVVGAPSGRNHVELWGPDGEPGVAGPPARVRTDLFVLQGREAQAAGIAVTRAVYARGTDGEVTVDVFAAGEPGQAVEVRGPALRPTRARGRGGVYVARLRTAAAPPATVTAVNVTDLPASTTTVVLLDAVTVSAATYDLDARTLTVTAASADEAVPPALEVAGLGPLVAGTGTFAVDAPPVEVTVRSAAGGSARATVTLTGAELPAVYATPGPRTPCPPPRAG